MIKSIATATAAAMLSVVALAAPSQAATVPTAVVQISCAGGVHINAEHYPTHATGLGNVWIASVDGSGSFGFFDAKANVHVPIPQDGRRHDVRVWVHNPNLPAGWSYYVAKTTRRCSL